MTGKSNIFSEANHEYLLTFLDDLANRHGEESRQLHNELKIIKGDIENIYEDFKDSILKTRQEIQTEIRGELEYTLKRMKNITEVQQDEIRSLRNELGSLHRKVDSNSKKHNRQLSVVHNSTNENYNKQLSTVHKISDPISNITSFDSYIKG